MDPNIIICLCFIVLLMVIMYQYNDKKDKKDKKEPFETSNIFKQSLVNNFSDKPNLMCILDVTNVDCKTKTNLYPLHSIMTTDNVILSLFNDGNLYTTTDNKNDNLWRGPLKYSKISGTVNLQMITLSNSGYLMGVGTDNKLYVKETINIEAPWKSTPVPNCDGVIYVLYDNDDVLMGLNTDGYIVKKENRDITSKWTNIGSRDKKMLKLYWDINNHLLGIGTDFKLYQKKLDDWVNSSWKSETSNEKVFDIFYELDGRMLGFVIVDKLDTYEIMKQNLAYYSAPFYPLYDVIPPGIPTINLGNQIYSKTGSKLKGDNLIDEDELPELKDPTLEEIQQNYSIDSQQKVKQMCLSKKHVDVPYNEFELMRQIENQDNVISKMKDEIKHYMSIDKKYINVQDDLNTFADVAKVFAGK